VIVNPAQVEDAKAIQAEIDRLTMQLAVMKAMQSRLVFLKDKLNLNLKPY